MKDVCKNFDFVGGFVRRFKNIGRHILRSHELETSNALKIEMQHVLQHNTKSVYTDTK